MMAVPRNFVDYEGIYLLSHSIGLPVRGAREAVADYFKVWESDTPHAWPQWLGAIDHFRETLGQLIGGPPGVGLPPEQRVERFVEDSWGAPPVV